MEEAFLNWSSGKDAALALYRIQQSKLFKIAELVTTVNTDVERVSMHGLRNSLLKKQAEAIGLPLHTINLPSSSGMETYTKTVEQSFKKNFKKGLKHAIYGDIFLEDLRAYRDKSLENCGIKGLYPLWKEDTSALAREIIDLGFKAITVAVSAEKLDKSFCGKTYDHEFLNRLPQDVDPCGEHGEFHTFVYDGPIFNKPVNFKQGAIVQRDLNPEKDKKTNWDSIFWYCDLY